MPFTVSDGRLFQDGRPVKFVQANAFGRRFKAGAVVAVVHHDTASGKGSAVRHFANPKTKNASAHVVVEPDGSVIQCVDLRFAAYHAGYSALNGKWSKKTSCNGQTLGIEITNPGVMERVRDEAQLIYKDLKPPKIIARYPLADCKSFSSPSSGAPAGTFMLGGRNPASLGQPLVNGSRYGAAALIERALSAGELMAIFNETRARYGV